MSEPPPVLSPHWIQRGQRRRKSHPGTCAAFYDGNYWTEGTHTCGRSPHAGEFHLCPTCGVVWVPAGTAGDAPAG